jgi:tRNA pseudouridine32 synthase/23S rRNA pseudouridine746 synthase
MKEHQKPFELHLTISKNDQTIIDCLSENSPKISKQKLKQAMKYGAVWLTSKHKNNQPIHTSRIRRAKKTLQVGYEVHLYYDESILFSDIKPAELVADEGEYSIWNKPCGMFSQGGKWGDHTSIARWVEVFGLAQNQLSQRPVFLVHRLDRATNGLIIVAHSKQAANQLAGLFESRKIEKRYSAVVNGKYPSEAALQTLNAEIDGKSATSLILLVDHQPDTNQTSLLINILTGRKHQIRKHLSAVGYPVVGDRLYGECSDGTKSQPDLMLRSCFLEFECPLSHKLKTYRLSGY